MAEEDTERPRMRAADPWTRSQAADDQDLSADDRDRTAADRDHVSEALDEAAEIRDERADERDRRSEARAEATNRFDVGAAADRAGAWRDRRGSASDRRYAADDRQAASTDRFLSARERAVSSIDELTGAHRRDAGLVEMTREIARAQRTQSALVLAFVDVDGLKVTNDSLGHAAGDELLRRVVETTRLHLRAYDLVMRFGGDEFLCILADVSVEQARERFRLINVDLAENPSSSITVGLAALSPTDSLNELIDRADTALRQERQRRRSARA